MFETRSVITIPIGKKLPAKRGEKGEREKEVHTRDLRNALDIGPTKNGQMWWESKRGKCQLLEVIDRRSIRLQISHSLSDFFLHSFYALFVIRKATKKIRQHARIIFPNKRSPRGITFVGIRWFFRRRKKKKGTTRVCHNDVQFEQWRHAECTARNKWRTSSLDQWIELATKKIEQLPSVFIRTRSRFKDSLKSVIFYS